MKRINIFDNNISTIKRRERLMELSGIPIKQNENQNEIDELDEILKEMGYPIENPNETFNFGDISKEELRKMIQKVISEMEDELDINEVIENLTKNCK